MIYIKEGKEKSLLRHHPWVFTGAIDEERTRKDARLENGREETLRKDPSAEFPEEGKKEQSALQRSYRKNSETQGVIARTGVHKVADKNGRFIAWGYYDEESHIVLRLLSWDENDMPDGAWWERKTSESISKRAHFFSSDDTNAFRIIHGEADYLPGVAADVYGALVRVVISARMAFFNREHIVSAIQKRISPELIILNTDAAFCGIEKLKEITEYYKSGERFYPDAAFEPIQIKESGIYYTFTPGTGQKSGFYCDQRENRNVFEKYVRMSVSSSDRKPIVLDACSYTGAFTLHALRAGAERVDAVDVSEAAIECLMRNVKLNIREGVLPENAFSRITTEKADVFAKLRTIPSDLYDLIILDPPKLAKTVKNLEEAKKGYKDLNRLAMQKIKNGGVLFTCSCSGALKWDDFRTVIGWAAKDAGVEVQILEALSQKEDHPVRLSFPESEYLKVYALRILK